MAQDELTIVNGWTLFAHPLFQTRLEELVSEVEQLVREDPDSFQRHPAYKLMHCVERSIRELVPTDPSHKDFRQGRTLGQDLTHWCRVKKTLPSRYRLFFQYRSSAPQAIIYAWLNDDRTLRQDGARTDCYAVFKRLVAGGTIPNGYQDLLKQATALPSAS